MALLSKILKTNKRLSSNLQSRGPVQRRRRPLPQLRRGQDCLLSAPASIPTGVSSEANLGRLVLTFQQGGTASNCLALLPGKASPSLALAPSA